MGKEDEVKKKENTGKWKEDNRKMVSDVGKRIQRQNVEVKTPTVKNVDGQNIERDNTSKGQNNQRTKHQMINNDKRT
jgi:hypothetical protein